MLIFKILMSQNHDKFRITIFLEFFSILCIHITDNAIE